LIKEGDKDMEVYVLIKIIDMSDFVDSDYNIAEDSEVIVGIYNEYEKALEEKEKEEKEDRILVEELECDAHKFRIDTWKVK
jgi:hypothetical protein